LISLIHFLVPKKTRIVVSIYVTLSLAYTHESYCYRHTGKQWPNTHTHTYEDTHTIQNKEENKKTQRQQKVGGGKKKRVENEKEKKKGGRERVQGDRGAWLMRRL